MLVYRNGWTDAETITVSVDEAAALFLARLDALTDATKISTGGQPLPISWRTGWSAELRVHKRDRDGSVLASIVVTSPNKVKPYRRRIRLVRRHSRASERTVYLRRR
jgi:hypothetical protein